LALALVSGLTLLWQARVEALRPASPKGETVKPALPLLNSSLSSLSPISKAKAKQHYLSRHDWTATIAHDGGDLVLAARLPDIALLGVILSWTPPPTR
jgi:hypothetical protein